MAITPKQMAVYQFIKDFIKKYHYSPTLREIADHLHLNSGSTVHKFIKSLQQANLIEYGGPNQKRALKLLPTTMTARPTPSEIVYLQGYVRAGEPLQSYDNPEPFPLPTEMLGRGETFVLKVEGESMIDEYILEGDFVIIDSGPSPKNGDMVVATIRGESVTLKKFFREKGKIRLQPANPNMSPLVYSEEEVVVNGLVIGLIRNYKRTLQPFGFNGR